MARESSVREVVGVVQSRSERSEGALTDDDQLLFTLGYHTDFSLLILGETGVGKTHLARRIHDGSARARGPFVVADCGAMTESLFEAELFGHRKGAFTGAVQSADGLVARAEGGTLLLDEIGNLPAPCQAKILRLIETRCYRPVGEATERVANVRVLAATNLDVDSAVAEGKMRSDLYYRLTSVRPVRVRALRERPAALRDLAVALLTARIRPDEDVCPLSLRVLDWICTQPWPGNVRQLKGIVEVALELARVRWAAEPSAPNELMPQDFLRAAGAPPPAREHPHLVSSEAPDRRLSPGEAGHRAWVVSILESVNYNQSRASEIAGVSRRTMINWIERYNLPRPRAVDEAPRSRRRASA